jgi:autotransporter-associated beta strand protein
VYVVGADDDAIAIFERDEQSGLLTFSQSVVTGEADLFGVRGIAASGDGRHLYTASSLGGAVAAFRVPTVHVMRIISGQIAEEMDFASFVTAPIWSGRGEDAFWSTPDNWLGRNPPVDDDELIFEGDTNTTNFNDLPPGLIARSIELVDGGFLITGQDVALDAAGGTAILHRQGVNRLRLPLVFQSPGKLRVDQGALNLWGRLNIGPHTIVLQTHEGASNTLSGQVIGAGRLVKTGDGTLTLSGVRGAENAYGGSTLVEAGTVQLAGWATLGDEAAGTEVLPEATLWIATQGVLREPILLSGSLQLSAGTHFAGSVTVGPDAILSAIDATTVQFSGTVDIAEEGDGVTYESQHELTVLVLSGSNSYRGPTRFTGLGAIRLGASDAVPATSAVFVADDTTWQLAGFAARVGSLAGAGRIELDGGTLTVGGDDTATEFAGKITGSGQLVKTGAGTLTLLAGLDHTGPTRVSAGQLEVNGSATAGPVVTVHEEASLIATGELARPVEVHDGGRLSPGPEIAELAVADLTLQAGSTLSLDVRSADHDRLVVTGSVSLAGARLSLLIDAPPDSKRLVLIDNDGADAVAGFFVDMPEGQLRVAGGVQFAVTYTGGDGNDVELITISTISGLVFNDRNGDAVRGATETPLSGWRIYLDQNSNGQFDADEPTTVTDSDGRYTFHDVAAGVARVTQVTSDLWTQTTPDREPFVLSFQQAQTNSGPVDSLDGAWSVAVSPDGRHVYAASTVDSALTALSRDVVTGRLSFIESHFDNNGGVDGLAGAVSVTVSPDGRHVVAAGLFDNAIAVFTRNESTGRLVYVETKRDGVDGIDGLADVLSVTLSPDGRHVYAAGNRDNALAVFRRDAEGGRLTFVEMLRDGQKQGASTIDGLAGAWHVTVSPDGRHVYATANLENALAVFARDEASGQLTYVQRIKQGEAGVASLDGASGVAVSPDGANVYVTADRDDTVTVFARDPETGHVTLMEVFRQGVGEADGINGANSIAVSPDGGLVYVTGLAFDSLAAFTRDAQTGALTFLEVRSDNFQGVDGLDGIRAVTVSPDGRHIYTAASLDDAVTVFERDVPYFQFRLVHGQVVAGLEFGVKVNGPKLPANGEVEPPPDDRGGIDVSAETSPRVLIQPAVLALIEGGDALSYTVVLSARPAADWTVTMVADDAQVELSTSRLVFTPHDWDVPRVVSVTAVDDGVPEASRSVTIVHRVTGDDPLRRPTASNVVVNIADPAVVPGGVVGDTNRDGVVDLTDLNNVRNNFGRGGPGVEGDTNGDGVVDLTDLNNVRNNFGATAAPSVPGDTNGDDVVDLTDLNNVRNSFGRGGPGVEGDTNGDGVVDLTDLNNVRNNFGARPSGSLVPLPQPGGSRSRLAVTVAASGDPVRFATKVLRNTQTLDDRVVATLPRGGIRPIVSRAAEAAAPWDVALLAMLAENIEMGLHRPI